MALSFNNREKDANYYDEHKDSLCIPLWESPWLDNYKKTMSVINKNDRILDLGCGAGRFAKLLFLNGFKKYLGVDFSAELIKECNTYVPEFNFICGNILEFDDYENYDTIVILEVLEHIKDDIKLLKSIPKGKTIVFSVPNYLSSGHVRAFSNFKMINDRYGKYVNARNVYTKISKKPWNHINYEGKKRLMHTKIFLLKGEKI